MDLVGGVDSRGGYVLKNFVCQNERNRGPLGRACAGHAPLDAPIGRVKSVVAMVMKYIDYFLVNISHHRSKTSDLLPADSSLHTNT